MTENRTVQNEDGSVSYEKDFDWNSQEKGFALGAFFYGYIATHFIGGVLATKYGGHLVSFIHFCMKYFSAKQIFLIRSSTSGYSELHFLL